MSLLRLLRTRAARNLLAIAASGFALTALVPTVATAKSVFTDVFVQNTADSPVPTQAVGTTNVSGTVDVGNLPAVQDVHVVAGSLPSEPRFVDAAWNSGLLQLEKLTSTQVAVNPRIAATTISIDLADGEHSLFSFKANVPGCGLCTVLQVDAKDSSVVALPTPMLIERIDVTCNQPGQFLDNCLPQIFVAGLKPAA